MKYFRTSRSAKNASVLSAYRVTQSFTEMEFTNCTIFHGFSENKCGNGKTEADYGVKMN